MLRNGYRVKRSSELPKMTTKEYTEIRTHCVQEVQEKLNENPMQKIDEEKEREWISAADKGKQRWHKYLRCMKDANPAIKYYAEEKCGEKLEDGAYVIGMYFDIP